MTPKEKAMELVNKFTVVGLQRRNEGIQCAIIAVNEILINNCGAMTPKEKAIELVDKFYQTTPNEAFYNPPIGSITSDKYSAWEQSKQCALIAVDEIETLKAESFDKLPNPHHYFSRSYWREVKTEIENL